MTSEWEDPKARNLLLLSIGMGIFSSVALSEAYKKRTGRADLLRYPYLSGTLTSLLAVAWAEYLLSKRE